MCVYIYIYIYIHTNIYKTESLCCIPETNTMLKISYTSTKEKKRIHHYTSPIAIKYFYVVCLPSVSEVIIHLPKWEKPTTSAYHTWSSHSNHLIVPLTCPLSTSLHRHNIHFSSGHWLIISPICGCNGPLNSLSAFNI